MFFTWLMIACIIIAAVVVPAGFALFIVVPLLLICLTCGCCCQWTIAQDSHTLSDISRGCWDFWSRATLIVGIGYLLVFLTPVIAMLLEAIAVLGSLFYVESGTWSIPCMLTYPLFMMISYLVTGVTTADLPLKEPHDSLQTLPIHNDPVTATAEAWRGYEEFLWPGEELAGDSSSSWVRRYVSTSRKGWSFLWFSFAFPICFILSILMIPLTPVLMIPKLIMGTHRCSLPAAYFLGSLGGACTYFGLPYMYMHLHMDLSMQYRIGLSCAVLFGCILLAAPPNSNCFYFVAPLWYGVVCPISVMLHGWSFAAEHYLGPVDFIMTIRLLPDVFLIQGISTDHELEPDSWGRVLPDWLVD